MITFGRDICGDLATAESREWLVTNGIGGFASGTLSGMLSRQYHGILVAALKPPLDRTVLVSKLEETADYLGISYPLYTNRWQGGIVDPHGYRYIESFYLDGTIPVWRYALGDALLEKRIWMQQGANTTYVLYSLIRGTAPVNLLIRTLVNTRNFHGGSTVGDRNMQIDLLRNGVRVRAAPEAQTFHLFSDQGQISTDHQWIHNFELSAERSRGLGDTDDHLHAATFTLQLSPGGSLTLVASTDPQPDLDGFTALEARQDYEQSLIDRWRSDPRLVTDLAPDWIEHLVLAADQFIVDRPSPEEPNGKSIIAGYHWFADWGRDAMISLPGLALCTARPEVARSILSTFARYLDQGMVPNRFPDVGEEPEYNTVDATLWYFEAIRAYHQAHPDPDLIHTLFPALQEVIQWHRHGTRFNIHVDPGDGLLIAGEAGVQLTWMDAKIGDWVVTPRMGKPIEINALWINALKILADWARSLGEPDQDYETLAQQAITSFKRYWNPDLGYCFDVLDGTEGDDPALRPNQLFALSLPDNGILPPLLAPEQEKQILEHCGQTLLTSHGLRSLAPADPNYRGLYAGDPLHRDGSYHQGTTWGWLIGPYVQAHLRVFQDPDTALEFLDPMEHQLRSHGVGNLSEIFDGDAPMLPRGCIAQAWTVAEVLRSWLRIQSQYPTP